MTGGRSPRLSPIGLRRTNCGTQERTCAQTALVGPLLRVRKKKRLKLPRESSWAPTSASARDGSSARTATTTHRRDPSGLLIALPALSLLDEVIEFLNFQEMPVELGAQELQATKVHFLLHLIP